MHMVKQSFILVLAAATLALAGCAAQRQSMGEYFGDAAVTARVKKAFYQEPSLKVTEIGVSTEDGVVTLSGTVKNRGAAVKAGLVARKVDGVKAVRNDLKVGR